MITRQQTRNQNANLDTETLQPEQIIINVGVTDDGESRINRLVTAALTAQQTQLFSELKLPMTSLIQSSLETTFRNFSAQDSSLFMPSFETRHNISQLPPVQRSEETQKVVEGLLFFIMLKYVLLSELFFITAQTATYDCSNLLMGQYLCPDPSKNQIDQKTQQYVGCDKSGIAKVWCIAAEGIECETTGNNTFTNDMPCKWTNGYHLDTVLLLSVFTGMFGLDRFYLGYYGIGLLKVSTLGGFFIGQLVDIILIALQIVRPADGSYYIIPYYGAVVEIIRSDNETYRVPKDDW
uniref:TM2 domain-containing protein n=2 Tax=Nemorhina TaxID=44051 RepID=A0A1B0BY58_9MUSC